MFKPRIDVTERKLNRVREHIERHRGDGYAAANEARLQARLRTSVEDTYERVKTDKARS